MKTKKCSKCKKIKPLSEFHKDKYSKDNHNSWCKECYKKHYEENLIRIRKQHRKYRKQHYRKKPIKTKLCEVCNKEFKTNYSFQKYCSKECYKIAHAKLQKVQKKKYYQDNKDKIKEYKRKYERQRRKIDINFKILCNLRNRVNFAIRNNSKSKNTAKLLNCSIDYYKQYLENQFTSKMTWENYGSYWEIDHIRPCVSFDLSKPEEQYKCFNYKNTRPLTKTENRSKSYKYKGKKVNK